MTGAWLQTPETNSTPSALTRCKYRIGFGWVALAAAAGAHGLAFVALLSPVDGQSPKPISAPLVVSLMMPVTESLPVARPESKPKIEPEKITPKTAAISHLQTQDAVTESVAAPAETQTAPQKSPQAEAQPVVAARFDADYLNNPAPKYPPLARRLKEQGVVLVRVRVLPSGNPDEIELKQSSGSEHLDQAALTVVRQWRFVPAKQGSDAVAAWVVVPISFSLGA